MSSDPLSDERFLPSSPKRAWQSWGLSLLVHGLCLGILLAIMWSVPQTGGEAGRTVGIALTLVEASDRPAKYLLEPPATELPISSQETLSSNSLTEPSLLASESIPSSDSLSSLDSQIERKLDSGGAAPLADVSGMLDSVGSKGLGGSTEMSEADLKRLAQEQARIAALQPIGEPTELSVFGSEPMSGRKFVFLIDQSDSMGSGGLGVLAESKSELGREINKLQDYHQFQVVAYNERTTMMRRRQLIPATAENKSGVAGFIEGLVAAGGTHHEGGLMVAVGLEPDVIVWISDGGDPALSANSLDILERLVQDRIQIHCLQFGIGNQPTEANPFMQQLAKQNAGRYRYIDVSLWTSNRN